MVYSATCVQGLCRLSWWHTYNSSCPWGAACSISEPEMPAFTKCACCMQHRHELYLYILSGWECSAANICVCEDTHSTDFTIPEGWYYLGDAGYAISDCLLVPYCGVQYHIKEWGQSWQRCVHTFAFAHYLPLLHPYNRPWNYKELLNYQNALLRNHIEHIFGLFKRHFKVFTHCTRVQSHNASSIDLSTCCLLYTISLASVTLMTCLMLKMVIKVIMATQMLLTITMIIFLKAEEWVQHTGTTITHEMWDEYKNE